MQEINQIYIELWREYSDEFNLERIPLVYPELNDSDILFVGINPSFDEDWSEERGWESFDNPYKWENRMDEKLQEAQEARIKARGQANYFQHFREWFGPWHNGGWEHIDIFAIRETTQNKVKSKLKINSSNRIESEFAQRQFDAAIDLIDGLNPEVIVVVNALASKLIQNHAGEDYQISEGLDQDLGCHYMELAGTRYPILFSGMITGQRALDVGSRERLKWQIDRIVSNIL